MKVIIDRFEGDFAVVELDNKQFINMPKQLVPDEAGEGSVLSIEMDQEESDKRKERISKLMNQVWEER